LSTAAKNADLHDDFAHRTPHFGFTSETKEQSLVAPLQTAKSKDKAADSLHKLEGHQLRQRESHSQVSRDRDSSLSRNRQELVRHCKHHRDVQCQTHPKQDSAAKSSVLPADSSSRFTQEMLAAFERRIDKKIRVS
jgi:hypothetical protein